MRRASLGMEPHAKQATCRDAQAVVRRLAVDEKTNALRCLVVGHARAIAAALFADDEQQRDARLASRSQPLGGRYLRSEDALRVTGTTAKHQTALLMTGIKRWHTVEVR